MLYKFARPAVILVLVIALLGVFGIRITHPETGLKSALGSAKSTLVVYIKSQKVGVGSRAIVDTGVPHADPNLSYIRGVEATTVDVQSGQILQRIPKKSIKGKMLLVIPFIGYLF